VLQADGGTRCAAITGGYVALALAVRRLQQRGELERNPLRDSVAAVSAGVVDGKVLLDLPYEEDVRAEVDMNVVATGSGRFVEVQGTGEECTFSREELDGLTTLALEGIAALTKLQEQALAEADLER
jgi:ribonuclease PH